MAAPHKKKKSPKTNSKDNLKPKTSAMKFSNRKNKAENDAKTGSFSLPADDDEPDFPRGGRSFLSQEEEEEVRAEVDAKFKAEGRDAKKRKKRVSRTPPAEEDLGFLFGGTLSGNLPRFANRITLKNISPGMKVLGVVVEINPKDLVISLPGGLRGFVRAEEALDLVSEHGFKGLEGTTLCNTFVVGQLVSSIVLHVDDDKEEGKGNKKIWLSLRLALLHKGLSLDSIQDGMVLTAYVKSIEDHGYILSFGLPSFTGFLPIKRDGDGSHCKMRIGQLLQGVVHDIDKLRGVVHLNYDPDLVSKSVIKDVKGLSLDLLVPGMMVNTRVLSTLENGILLSFLTYFTGTVDIFHLQNSFPNASWKNDYDENKKVIARILFIDPLTRAVGLTMNSYLLHNNAPPLFVKIGDIHEDARIIRVDGRFGLLLEIPTELVQTPVYVGISDASDGKVCKLETKFKEGSRVRVRVLGFRHLEGMATGSLKAGAFEGSILTHADVKPGMLVKGKVIAVEDFGAIINFASGIKALCPLRHMSEFEIAKPGKKFKVGAELMFRVLGCKSKRITVTHKKTLVRSKLGIVASYADATKGLVTHGWISKIESHGCFVNFYNGVKGFAHRSELGLELGSEASSTFHVGQVVKCRVISAIPASRRINLSFVTSSKRTSIDDDDDARLGNLVSGIVEKVTPMAVIVHVNSKSYLKGTISIEHLADHQGHAAALKSLLKRGFEFDQLLVLDVVGINLILSAKYSLINSAKLLPLDIAQIHPHTVIPGYICNVIGTGCFVRFLGHLTGFSSKNRATEDPNVELSKAFYIGQSVRSHILNVDGEAGKIAISLKQSTCFSTDASFIQGYFLSEDKIAKLQLADSGSSESKWMENFTIGSLVEGEIQEIKEFGVVVNFTEHSDVVGFISENQLGGVNVQKGLVVRALVLDVSKTDGLVDMSLKPDLVSSAREVDLNRKTTHKKHRRESYMGLEMHQTISGVVEMAKDNYLVLSIPDSNNLIGFASTHDYNMQKLPHKNFKIGQRVTATVKALPSSSSCGRLLLLLDSLGSDTSSSKRAKKRSSYDIGSIVEAEITDVKPLELRLKFGINFHGRVHITEVTDNRQSSIHPLSNFRIGQLLTARLIAKIHPLGNRKKGHEWELSVKPSVVSGAEDVGGLPAENLNFSVGEVVTGYVIKVDNEWVRLTVCRDVKAQLFILDSSNDLSELQGFRNHFTVGQAVSGSVLSINKEKRLMRLTLCSSSVTPRASVDSSTVKLDDPDSDDNKYILEGDILNGRISKVLPGTGGLQVQIGPHLFGKVHFTELRDMWVCNPLDGYCEGQFVKCKVLEISQSFKGTVHVELSLRPSQLMIQAENSMGDLLHKRFEKIEDLRPDMDIQGYVKNVTPKGCFVMLSRKIDAKILLSNLSNGYLEKPENEFPIGRLVTARVLSVEPLSKRVELTLKTVSEDSASKSVTSDLHKLPVGDVISGNIRRIEPYGLFINIDSTNMVGLCHISEVSDSSIENIESKYKVGDKVLAKILKVDSAKQRVSLGMKNSYMGDNTGVDVTPNQIGNKDIDVVGSNNGSEHYMVNLVGDFAGTLDPYGELAVEHHPVLEQAESRASIPPLEVPLDDLEGSDLEVGFTGAEETHQTKTIAEKSQKHMKKKAKEARELEIRAAEDRLLENDVPRTADEFEKWVRSSPNSSVAWINYMAFMLSQADVEKARSIAERALQTINVREEEEKMHIWVAYFNLENEYGKPREEAVVKIFQRALQYCDAKKIHLALLGMYERTNQHNVADELLNRMTKKFKTSCKVWLRRIENILKQGKNGIQSAVNRALLVLPRNKHIKFISKAAILEFKCGVPDHGRSMFEGILREYPKKTDLWSVYLDQEIRLGDVDMIRALFERAICLSLPPKKMKFLFKKYLEYEKSRGDEDRVKYVKKKAMDYVESSLT